MATITTTETTTEPLKLVADSFTPVEHYTTPDPNPIPASYKPTAKLQYVPADAPLDDILAVIERDGVVVLQGVLTSEEIATMNAENAIYIKKAPGFPTFKDNPNTAKTKLVQGLVDKSKGAAKICQHPTINGITNRLLTDEFYAATPRGRERHVIKPLLSMSNSFNIPVGTPRQNVHRDDAVHIMTNHPARKEAEFTVIVAGTEFKRENGATMMVPGSHKWPHMRQPKWNGEITFAEMQPGDAVVYLGSTFHGGGHNASSDPDFVRIGYAFFFARGTRRCEENQFLAHKKSKVLSWKDNEIMMSLLGYKTPTTGMGMAELKEPAAELEEVLAKITA